jgi:hypothetical protein
MTIVIRIVLGLVLAAIVYLVGTAVIHFHDNHLVFGLIAVLVLLFVIFAPGNPRGRAL